MITEQALRDALEVIKRELIGLQRTALDDELPEVSEYIASILSLTIEPALALPATSVKRQWRMPFGSHPHQFYEVQPSWMNPEQRARTKATIQHRDVPEPGPWELGE